MSNLDSVSSVSSSSNQQLIASLQSQMLRYAQSTSGNAQAQAAYQALQSAIQKGDVSTAQAALARLRQETASQGPAASSGTADNDGGGSTGTDSSVNGSTFSTTA